MNVSNLQLQGLYLVFAGIFETLVDKGLLTREELDLALARAEQVALGEERTGEALSSANRDALAFPARLLRLANSQAASGNAASFTELARLVGQTKGHYPDEV